MSTAHLARLAHHDVVGAFQLVGDVECERRHTAAVPPDLVAVHPHARLVVHGAEVEPEPARLPRVGNGEAAPVPDDLVGGRVADAAQPALRAVRDQDRPREAACAAEPAFGEAAIGLVEIELPRAVQRLPLGPHAVRARMLGPGHVRRRGDGGGQKERGESEAHAQAASTASTTPRR